MLKQNTRSIISPIDLFIFIYRTKNSTSAHYAESHFPCYHTETTPKIYGLRVQTYSQTNSISNIMTSHFIYKKA